MSFSSYESNFGTPNADPHTCHTKTMGYPSPSALNQVPEAHSKPSNFLTDTQHQPISQNSVKYSPFANGLENSGFREPQSSKDIPNVSNLNLSNSATSTATLSRKRAEKSPAHVKKPLNAFMLFMKEMRAKVVAECTMKESAAINQILGRKWHALPHEEQAKFYEMARKEKELHQRLYPGWSARDNYAYHAKRRKNRCRYRVYNNHQGQSRDRSPLNSNQDEVLLGKGLGTTQSPATSSNMGGMLKCPPFYKCSFPIGTMGYSDQRCSSTDDLMPYLGLIDRNQQNFYQDQHMKSEQQQQHQQQQSQLFGLNSQQGNLESGAKEDYKPRLPGHFLENVDQIPSCQHFNPPNSWLLGNNHSQTQSAYDLISSASTSPWSQTQQQIEDRFQRHFSQPSCTGMPNQYSTPPYNPNGSFDSHYNEVNSNYFTSRKSSPVPIDPHSLLKTSNSYQPTFFPTEYEDPENPIIAPIHGFSST